MRSMQVDVAAAAARGIRVCRVPTYSPGSVAEHAIAMLQCLNRYATLMDHAPLPC